MSNLARSKQPHTIATVTVAPSGAGSDILILTEDDLFLMEARRAVKLPNRVWHATSDTQAADMLMSKPCAAALLDVSLLTTRLNAVVTRLHQQFPDLGIVLTGENSDAAPTQALVGSGMAERFVAKTSIASHLARALEAGIDRHLEVRGAEARLASARKRRLFIATGTIAALALSASAAWYGYDYLQTQERTLAPGSTALLAELEQARAASQAGHYFSTASAGLGAVEHYRTVLSADPKNAEAREALHGIAETLLIRADAALAQGKPQEAAAAIEQARAADAAHPRIAVLGAQLARKQPASSGTGSLQQTNQELVALLQLGNERLQQDKLLEPARDNAREYLTAASALSPEDPHVQSGLQALALKFMNKSDQAAARNDLDGAERWLAEARALNVRGIDLSRAEYILRIARQLPPKNQ